MISGKVLTAAFLINRTWPIQQVDSGQAGEVIAKALCGLSAEETAELKTYVSAGSFLA